MARYKSPNSKRPVHTKVLVESTRDMVELGFALEERFVKLLNFWFQVKGECLVPGPEYNADLLLWRTMRARHKANDFRNTEDEKRATRRVAEWSHMKNCEIRNQTYKKIEWSD